MINKIHTNKLNMLGLIILTTFTYLLNHCTKIYQCAFMFTCIILITNFVAFALDDRIKSLKLLGASTLISFILLFKMPYYIDGQIINGLVVASFCSLMTASYWSSLVFQNLRKKYFFLLANFISIMVAAIVDGFVMGLFFLINNKFPLLRIVDIFVKEISYKTIYGLTASIILFILFKIFILIIRARN